MKNEEKTLKFPVGAIFMLLFVLLDIVQLIQIFSIPSLVVDFGLISKIICTIALCAIAVLVIMKNRGVGMLVSAGLIALRTIIYFSVSSLFYLISIACIILFSLDDMKIGSFAKYRKIIKLKHLSSETIMFIDPGEEFSEDVILHLNSGIYRVTAVWTSVKEDCICGTKQFIIE